MSVKIQTIGDIGKYLTLELNTIYPASEIRAITSIVIMTLFRLDKLHQMAEPLTPVEAVKAAEIISICNKLKTGRPIQYIIGETIFYGCKIKLNAGTLIPRQETEELVDLIIKENRGFKGRIIDFGTGSGCIAIALSKNLPLSEVFAIDISEESLAIANENSLLNDVRVNFRRGDILNLKPAGLPQASILVSNPPYVRESEKVFMNRNVVDFEPHEALFVPDTDPLLFYRPILNSADFLLTKGGLVYFEINEALGAEMEDIFMKSGLNEIKIIKDINGRDRIIKGKYYGRKGTL